MRWLTLSLALGLAACRTSQTPAAPLTPREHAQLLVSRGDAAGAVTLLEPLAAAAPNNLTLARALAEAHVKAGSAQTFIERLAAHDTAVSHYQRGLILFARASDASGPAVTEFRRAVELNPDEPELSYRLGIALLESERYDDAKLALETATKHPSAKPGWFLPLAKAQHRSGDPKAALTSIRRVIEGEPTDADAKTAKALMEDITDPFTTFPKAAKPQLERAMNWLQVADVPQQAIVDFEEILHDYPDLAVVHALLGLAYARIDDSGRAVDEFKRAIELAPEDGKAHLYLGELYLGRQRSALAKEQFEQAVAHNPTLSTAWFRLGDMELERQELPAAKRSFFICARLEPDDINARGKLAAVYQLEGDWPAADRGLKAVTEREPENVEFMLRLGLLHTERFIKSRRAVDKKEAAAEASKWLEKVLEAQPENVMASKALERVKQP